MATNTAPNLIRLAENDNVLFLAQSVPAGTIIDIDGHPTQLKSALTLGHKVAARDIRSGETIYKYNFPIGVATEDIALGTHVHVHNMASNYTPTYVVEDS